MQRRETTNPSPSRTTRPSASRKRASSPSSTLTAARPVSPSSRSSSAAASPLAPSVPATPGRYAVPPRRSIGRSGSIAAAQGSAGRSSAVASPGSRGDSSARARRRATIASLVSSNHAGANAQSPARATVASAVSSSDGDRRPLAASDSTETGAKTVAAMIDAGSPASSNASRSASNRLGGAGSRTTAPPSVVSPRRTTRSPRTATTGEASRSCAVRSPIRATTPGTREVPWWTETRCPDGIGVSSSSVTSNRYELGNAPGVTSASPRRSCRRSTPGSPSATRSPAAARVTGVSCTWTERTRTSPPPGATCRMSPSAIVA